MEKLRTVRGVHDLLPNSLHKHNLVINEGLKISEKYCYEQIETPIFEFAEVFTKPLGKTSDIVTKENYVFKDRSQDELMLRPEGTSGVVRAFLNAGLTQDVPKRYSYFGPMFRYERPQKGRLRQFKQFGIECIGINNSIADVEVIALGYDFLNRLNILDKIKLKINTLGDIDSRLRYREVLVEYLNDYKLELSNESIKRLSENPLRILDSKNEIDKKIVVDAPSVLDYLNEYSKDRFEKVCEGLNALKIKYNIDKNLVRGLDYYCHTAFEFITSDLGSQGTVLAGGRYDGLAKMLGGPDIAGVGWAAGVERLALMIEGEYVNKPDLVLMAVSEKLEPLLLPIIKKLVDQDLKVEILCTGSMSKKFKRANKINASYAIILGEEEVSQNIIKLKNLVSGTEKYITLDEAIKTIKEF
ncbi:histidine--tRNA ligase [Alphaproteobacteria bacterium]|nr:histidine--tRNA ligase [Alphaproteobacteria bacterium]